MPRQSTESNVNFKSVSSPPRLALPHRPRPQRRLTPNQPLRHGGRISPSPSIPSLTQRGHRRLAIALVHEASIDRSVDEGPRAAPHGADRLEGRELDVLPLPGRRLDVLRGEERGSPFLHGERAEELERARVDQLERLVRVL